MNANTADEMARICASYAPVSPSPALLHRWICDLCPTFRIGLTVAPDGQTRIAFATLRYFDGKTRSTADFRAEGEEAEDQIIIQAALRLRAWLGLSSGSGNAARVSEAAIAQARAAGDHATAEFLETQLVKERSSK